MMVAMYSNHFEEINVGNYVLEKNSILLKLTQKKD